MEHWLKIGSQTKNKENTSKRKKVIYHQTKTKISLQIIAFKIEQI